MTFVYILRCADNTLYIGHTDDVERRVRTHNEGRGGAYTAQRRPVRAIYSECHPSVDAAIKRERQLKRWTRLKKEALVNGNPVALNNSAGRNRQTVDSQPQMSPPIQGRRAGIRTTSAIVCALALACALLPATGDAPTIRARADGLLEVDAPPGTVVRYTLDGTAPTRDAGVWLTPVEVPTGYTLKARAFTPDHAPVGGPAEWASRATGPRIASTLVPVTQGRDWRVYDWPARHAAAAALMKARQPEIVMLGDSIMHFWGGDPSSEHVGGRRTAPDVWDRLFTGRNVVNLGYGWDRTENVLWRLRHGEFDHVSPKVVVLMIGTNNIPLNTADEIAAAISAICDEIHQRSPTTRILLLGIFPRGEKPDANRATIEAVNQRIATLDGRGGVVTYLDIGDKLLAADRSISKDIMYDFLHPTAKGYAIWADAMEPTLTRLLSR